MHHILYLSCFYHRYVDSMISVSRNFPSPTCTFSARLTLGLFSGSWGPFYFRINKQHWWEQLNSWKNRLRSTIGSAHVPQSWLVAENHAHLAQGREWPLWKLVLCSYSFILRQSRAAQICSAHQRGQSCRSCIIYSSLSLVEINVGFLSASFAFWRLIFYSNIW